VTALFVVALIWGHWHHEFWRDETHPWLVARTASGLRDIVDGDRVYDGHPPLWYWYLYFWTAVTRDIVGLHIATIVAEGTAALLLLRHAPLPRLVKVLLTFSYMLGYEYGIMSRNYTAGVICAFAFAATYHPLRLRLSSFVWLALLALSSVYGLAMASAFLLVLLGHRLSLSRSSNFSRTVTVLTVPHVLAGAVLVVGSFAFAYLVTDPPDPNPYSPAWNFAGVGRTMILPALHRVVAAFIPLRQPGERLFWVATIPYSLEYPRLFEKLAYILPALALLCLFPGWLEAAAFVLGCFEMAFLQEARYLGHIRHWGHFFVFFVTMVWIVRVERPRTRNWLAPVFLLLLGLCQAEGFAVALWQDTKVPFSGAREAARAIEKAGLKDLPLVIGPDWAAPSLTGYLDRTFVSCETDEVNQSMVFHGRRKAFTPEALVSKAVAVARERHSPVLVISNRALPNPPGAPALKLIFANTIPSELGDENYQVYRLDL